VRHFGGKKKPHSGNRVRGEGDRLIPIAAGREEAGSGRREQTTQNSKGDRS